MQNWTILASAIPKISLGVSKVDSRDPDHAPFKGDFFILMLVLDTAYPFTKFDDSSLSRSRDIVGAHQNLNGSHDLTTTLSGMICHHLLQSAYLPNLKSPSPPTS